MMLLRAPRAMDLQLRGARSLLAASHRRGKKRTPTALRQLMGAQQSKLRDEPHLAYAAPICPKWFSKRATQSFKYISSLFVGVKITALMDNPSFELLCEAYTDYREIRKECDILRDNPAGIGFWYETESSQGGKMIRAHPALRILQEREAKLLNYLTEFGMTPASRSKVSEIADPGEKDRAEKYFQ